MKTYIVWNANRTQGFATTDQQLAYETRKCSDSNCFDIDGVQSKAAIAFIDQWGDDDFTTEVIPQNLVLICTKISELWRDDKSDGLDMVPLLDKLAEELK